MLPEATVQFSEYGPVAVKLERGCSLFHNFGFKALIHLNICVDKTVILPTKPNLKPSKHENCKNY